MYFKGIRIKKILFIIFLSHNFLKISIYSSDYCTNIIKLLF